MAEYDVIIVGAGIAGCSLAHALTTLPSTSSKPLRIAVLERSLPPPSRIVGELLQPSGVHSLEALSLESTLEGIEATKVEGYCVWDGVKRTQVHIPYPKPHEGRSFHHGRFVDSLRSAIRENPSIELIECTVSSLISSTSSPNTIVGVRGKRTSEFEKIDTIYMAPLTIIADGCLSSFRTQVLAGDVGKLPITTKSHFVGTILKDATLPIKYHGTVGLIGNGHGPVLLYQIQDPSSLDRPSETRMLVDVKAPLPRDLKAHIFTNIIPSLPETLHDPIRTSLESNDPENRIRTMPNSFLPPIPQVPGTKRGVFLLGDAYNMRHPLTGGGMSVALNDVVILRDLIRDAGPDPSVILSDWTKTQAILKSWYWKRKPLGSTINILSVALYDLFGADDQDLAVLRNGCFKYFELGGECVGGPVRLLSGITPSPLLLFTHFFAVAFYSIFMMFVGVNPVSFYGITCSTDESRRARPWEYPYLIWRGLCVFKTAVMVFGPLLYTELRFWSPLPTPSSSSSTASQANMKNKSYSNSVSLRFMALVACLLSVGVYHQVWLRQNVFGAIGAGSEGGHGFRFGFSGGEFDVEKVVGMLTGSARGKVAVK